MTPPDHSGQFGVPYAGSGHDAFGAPGVGHGQQQQYAPQFNGGQSYLPPQSDPRWYQRQDGYGQAHPGPAYHSGDGSYPGPEGFHEPAPPHRYEEQQPGYVEEYADEEEDAEPLIRPFAMTGGRTRPRYELALEALVSAAVDPARMATLLPEHQRICALCATDVKSVAEISALLNLPLGVARILVADLAEAGLVAIHQPAAGGESGNQPDVTLLERVLSGLRKL
ncbi:MULTISPECIES: DUF742 domain-containing protein [Kitasatospora]|uniref:DUF742 domain-containing protein n=1 Tax=Kitasatospora setae (strain ATCC 33774 / DSM 43861 / JCM 3304 / KCC A-0304 / NBRC 14216 / KM-6054) TaxID=452652 RepID=E4NHC8_KITSK|nr:DUF742 domain-containing protein [Kitasatospora setae]BAJ30908.1 hypothetical protein KSE_51290 [Kitasatospora setae KM-6054]